MVNGMHGKKGRKILSALFAVTVFFAAVLTLFWRIPQRTEKSAERYLCIFENGEEETLDFCEAFELIKGVSREGILLEKDEIAGKVRAGEKFSACAEGLLTGDALLLFSASAEGLTGLERAALYERFSGTGYYAGEFFAWNGTRVLPEKTRSFREAYLLDGAFKQGVLAQTGARKLVVKSAGKLTASALADSMVERVEAEAPYFSENGAVYLKTAGGVRLVAGLPFAEELTIDCDFLDEGALSPCRCLKRLKLPAQYEGTLKMLFGDTPVPEDLEVLV